MLVLRTRVKGGTLPPSVLPRVDCVLDGMLLVGTSGVAHTALVTAPQLAERLGPSLSAGGVRFDRSDPGQVERLGKQSSPWKQQIPFIR
jgi:hypothetical protein